MTRYKVKDPQGREHIIEGPEGATPEQVLEHAQRLLTKTEDPASFGRKQVLGVAEKALRATEPVTLTKKFFETDPAAMQRVGGPALPIIGGALGAFPGAAAGEAVRQFTGTALAPGTVPETALGRAASMLGAGVAQQPAALKALPGIPKVAKLMSGLASKTGKGMANAAQAFSGGKAGDFIEAAKKGFSTYAAPSRKEAGKMMGHALEKLPGGKVSRTMVERMESALTPESSAGNRYLNNIAKKLDKGVLIDAREALKAKQSLDAVIDTVPIWQTKRRAELFDFRRAFDDVLSSQSGELKKASNQFRAAVLKDNLTKPFPVNKHGEYSRLAGMLSTLGGSVGGSIGGSREGAKGGVIGAAAPLAAAVALSPASLGLMATSAGQFGKLASNPAIRQTLLQLLKQLTQGNQDGV